MIVDVPAAFVLRYDGKDDVATQSCRLGRCYELGSNGQMNFTLLGWDTVLVHGSIGPQKIPHCWVEFTIDGTLVVWDPIMDDCMTWAHARDNLHYRRWSSYAPQETARLHLEHSHPGPWGRTNNERYDRLVAKIQALQAELCSPGCTEWNHESNCEWTNRSTPLALM